MISTIYKVIRDLITTSIPEVKSVGMFYNQIYNERFDARKLTPAVYIEILPMTMNNRLNKVQTSDFTINLHVVTEVQNPLLSKDKESEDYSLANLELLDKIFAAIQSEAGSNEDDTYVYRLVRQNINISTNPSPLKDDIITLRAYLVDVSLIEASMTVILGEDGFEATITKN